jgi:SAM-dependent methyltransferase
LCPEWDRVVDSHVIPDGAVDELVAELHARAGHRRYPSYQPFRPYLDSLSTAGVRQHLQFLDYLVGPSPRTGISLLDVGSGYGLDLLLLRLLGFESVCGIEIVPDIAALSRLLLQAAGDVLGVDVGACTVEEADAERTGLPAGSFDRVTAIEMISHTPSLDRLLREMNRLLTPGGVLIISDGNNLSCTPYRLWLARKWQETRDRELPQRVACIQEHFPLLDEQAAVTLALHTELYSRERMLVEIARALEDDILPMALYTPGQAPIYFETGLWDERGFYPAELVESLRGYGFDACARTYLGAGRGGPFVMADRIANMLPDRVRFLMRPNFICYATKTGEPTYLVNA